MGSIRFRKSFRIAPGVKLNVNKQSLSVTGGVRGAHATYNTKGYRNLSVGIPGTGLSYRDTRVVGPRRGPRQFRKASQSNFPAPVWFVGAVLFGFLVAILILVAMTQGVHQ